jgi:dTDP-4-dehydrorhamnose 3,5-epimerase
MRFTNGPLQGSWVIDPNPIEDERGRFMRAWCAREFADHGVEFIPLQANMGFSARAGTVRGMHYQQTPDLEAKLIRCTRGAIFDVIVDLRPGSPTYRKWFGVELNGSNNRMLYVPQSFAHGYQTLTEDTEIYYLTSAVFAPASARGIRFDDPAIGIEWPLAPTMVSDQDRNWRLLN